MARKAKPPITVENLRAHEAARDREGAMAKAPEDAKPQGSPTENAQVSFPTDPPSPSAPADIIPFKPRTKRKPCAVMNAAKVKAMEAALVDIQEALKGLIRETKHPDGPSAPALFYPAKMVSDAATRLLDSVSDGR